MGKLRKLLSYCIYLFAVISILHYWVMNKSYLVDDKQFHAMSKKYAGTKDIKRSFNQLHQELLRKYPGHILPSRDLEWVYVNAGGFMGSMCLVHASLTEYILFFGAALDTTGHSGRYWANISDTVLTGQFKQWPEGALHANTFAPGDTVYHHWGETTAVYFKGGTWMAEYGRGIIPSTLLFALADSVFSTTDIVTVAKTFRVYGKALIQEWSMDLLHAFDWVKKRFGVK